MNHSFAGNCGSKPSVLIVGGTAAVIKTAGHGKQCSVTPLVDFHFAKDR